MNKSILWKDLNWDLIESRIDRLQARIYKSSRLGNLKRVIFLQKVLINSFDAKLLAVRQVTTENKKRLTSYVDKNVFFSNKDKMDLVHRIKIDGYAAPIEPISKPGRAEKRFMDIPKIKDFAKQRLALLALEPEWEARFEPNSYGFRPGRSSHDAIEAVFLSLRNNTDNEPASKYVFDADLKGCFDNIDHDYLISKLQTFPSMRDQVYAWLKAGIFEGFFLSSEDYSSVRENPTKTPQGGIISPFLVNVALHGMEFHLKDWITHQNWPMKKKHESYKVNKRKSLTIVRYADDFVVLHKDPEIVEKAKHELSDWLLYTSKLHLNEDKMQIKQTYTGFDFLGHSIINIRHNNKCRIKIYPSRKNQKELIDVIGDRCRKFRSISSYSLIESLRPKILAWANFFRYSECKNVFSKLDQIIFNILRTWVFRRDTRNPSKVVKERYFPSGRTFTFADRSYQNNWVLCGKKKEKNGTIKKNWLPKMSWVASIKYVKVKGDKSVYDGDSLYWSLRTEKYGFLNRRKIKLLKIQKSRCAICNGIFHDSSTIVFDHIIAKALGGKDTYANWQLLHKHCHNIKTQDDRRKIINSKSRAG